MILSEADPIRYWQCLADRQLQALSGFCVFGLVVLLRFLVALRTRFLRKAFSRCSKCGKCGAQVFDLLKSCLCVKNLKGIVPELLQLRGGWICLHEPHICYRTTTPTQETVDQSATDLVGIGFGMVALMSVSTDIDRKTARSLSRTLAPL